MAIVRGKWTKFLEPGLERVWLEVEWAEEIEAGNRKVMASVLEEAVSKLESYDVRKNLHPQPCEDHQPDLFCLLKEVKNFLLSDEYFEAIFKRILDEKVR